MDAVGLNSVVRRKFKGTTQTRLACGGSSHPALAPYKAAVLPLQKKLSEPAEKIYRDLSKHFSMDYDETSSIGKRCRRQDEAGTP